MKIFTKLIALALASTLLATASHAAVITEVLGVNVVSGVGVGTTGNISISYDDSLLFGAGLEFLGSSDFDLTLDLFGQLFNKMDDAAFPFLPEIGFENGAIAFIDFLISEDPLAGATVAITDSRIREIAGGDVINGVWEVNTVGNVPEPAAWSLLLFGAAALVKRRQQV